MQSESLKELAVALVAVQSKLKPAVKGSENPYFKSRYADLNAVWDSCRELLSKNGLCVVQRLNVLGETSYLSTMLLHTSGEWVEGVQKLNPVKDDPQGVGSAITYARRYGLASIIGIVSDEDDDGNAASQPTKKKADVPFETDERKEAIAKKVMHLGFNPQTKPEWEKAVKSLTDLALEEKNYDLIIERLDVLLTEKK